MLFVVYCSFCARVCACDEVAGSLRNHVYVIGPETYANPYLENGSIEDAGVHQWKMEVKIAGKDELTKYGKRRETEVKINFSFT